MWAEEPFQKEVLDGTESKESVGKQKSAGTKLPLV